MTVGEIIKKYLDDNGYDGLCGDECGCSKDNLFPCGMASLDCVPGYKCECNHECKNEYSDCFSTTKKCWLIKEGGEWIK